MTLFFAFQIYAVAVITGATQTLSFSLYPEERFVWGVATAAYQIEGAVTDGGRGPTIWDSFAAMPGKTDKGDTGEIADGSYYRIKEDVQLIKDMGLSSYRFSIAWSRVMPTGEMPINQAGIDHYNTLFDELERQGIEPLVTLYHWDLPSALEEKYEGWLSPDLERHFALYADVCFAAFGDRVKMWTTINEPWTFCLMGYVTGAFAPGRCSDRSKCAFGDSSTEGYIAAHNVLNAHAAAVQLYREKYQVLHGGKIGIVLNQDWAEPLTDDPLDIIAANRKNEFTMAWFNDPIVFGRYPDSMVELVGNRLPQFTPEQRDRLIGSCDYFAFNHYSTKYYYDPVRAVRLGEVRRAPKSDVENNQTSVVRGDRVLFDTTGGTGWAADQLNSESKYDQYGELIGPQAASAWLHVVPWGFYNVIMWNHNRYTVNNKRPVIYITENGCDVPYENDMTIGVALEDTFRVDYYQSYLQQMERAMADGVDIRGFYAWSLLDNYEWIDGFANRFGLTYIDYKNATLPRYPKRSSKWYAEYVRTHYSYDSSDPAGSGDDGNYYNDDYESSGAVGAHTSNSTSSGSSSGGGGGGGSENEGASRHKKNKRKKNDEKNKNKKGKGKGKDKGKRKGKGKGKGNSKNQNDDRGPILPVDDDYTLDPKNELFKGGVSAPLRDQAKRMVAVSSVGGFMDFLNAAMGSNHGAAVFGPQGLVPW